MFYRDNVYTRKITGKGRVSSTRKQVPDTGAHQCTMLSLRTQGMIIKKGFSHKSEGRGPLN